MWTKTKECAQLSGLIDAGEHAVESYRLGRIALPLSDFAEVSVPLDRIVPQLRILWRGRSRDRTLDLLEENIFLAGALRANAVPVLLKVGRELAPPARPARYFSWLHFGDRVLTTGSPVDLLYDVALSLPRV